MTRFSREMPTLGTSLALWRFRMDSGELSHFYWTGAAQSDFFAYATKQHPDSADPIATLKIQDRRYERRLGHDFAELRRRTSVEERWRRLLTVMLMSSAFERFLLSVAGAAVDSDPVRLPGFPKRVEGLMLKKYGLAVDQPGLSGLVMNDWSKRISEYRRLFSGVPQELIDAEGELEKLRKLRNVIAHEFASETDKTQPQLHLALGARRVSALESNKSVVSEERLIKWFRLLGVVSSAVDRHLVTEFVGGYETAALYLEWSENPDKFEAAADITMAPGAMGERNNRFGTMVGTLFQHTLTREYVPTLQKFIVDL